MHFLDVHLGVCIMFYQINAQKNVMEVDLRLFTNVFFQIDLADLILPKLLTPIAEVCHRFVSSSIGLFVQARTCYMPPATCA